MSNTNDYKEIWNDVYGKRFMTLWSPPEGVVQFVGRFLRKRLTVDKYDELFSAKRILDLGCGNGAVAAFLARQGYEVYGIDLSEPAIQLGRELLKHEEMQAELVQGTATELPYQDNFFDCVVSYAVLDHMMPDDGRQAIRESWRVLKNGGLLFLTLADTRSKKFGSGKEMAHNTYLLEGDWYEAGAVQHYFDREDINELLGKEFGLVDIRLVTQQKLDLNFKPTEWSWRWHLTAKKI